MFVIRWKRLKPQPGPLDQLAARALKIRMLFDKDTHAQPMGSVFDNLGHKVIVIIAIRFPEFPKNVDTDHEYFRFSSAEPKMFVPRMYGRAVPQNFDDRKSVVGAFLQRKFGIPRSSVLFPDNGNNTLSTCWGKSDSVLGQPLEPPPLPLGTQK
jgi:hypothetical protein